MTNKRPLKLVGRRQTVRHAGAHESHRYVPNAGLSVPVVTILDRAGEVLEDEQRAVVRWAVQNGNGGNIIWIDPEHDIVLVWHWCESGKAVDGMIRRIVASVTG